MHYSIGDIPSFKLYDSPKVFAFLDINPLSKGHAVRLFLLLQFQIPLYSFLFTRICSTRHFFSYPTRIFHRQPRYWRRCTTFQLVIPKTHGEKLTDIPDDELAEAIPVAKKIAQAAGNPDYNILQNNGKLAHQEVGHVHFHYIPKPNGDEGLQIGWPQQKADMDALKQYAEGLKSKM